MKYQYQRDRLMQKKVEYGELTGWQKILLPCCRVETLGRRLGKEGAGGRRKYLVKIPSYQQRHKLPS